MKYLNTSKIISIFFIFISLFGIALLIDANINDQKIFQSASFYFNMFMSNTFGNFPFLILSIGIFTGLLLIFFNNINTIIFTITGYLLFVLFLPSFFESYNIFNINGGSYGINMSAIILTLGFFNSMLLYSIWFFLSLFLLIFPVKNYIVLNIVKAFSNNSSINNTSPSRQKNIKFTGYSNNNNNYKESTYKRINKPPKNNKKSPWLSKIVFENFDSRIEIPVLPNKNEKIKKFKLINSDELSEEYIEIPIEKYKKDMDTIKESEEKYYNNLKDDWPDNWKKNKINNNNNEDNEIKNYLQDKLHEHEFLENEINNFNTPDHQYQNQPNDTNYRKNLCNDEYLLNSNFYENENNNYEEGVILPLSDILENASSYNSSHFQAEHRESARILEETLLEFGIQADVSEIIHGPVVTLYKIIPARGIKLQKIEGLSNNLALRLAAKSIRIIAPIPGEKVVGIEIPNQKRILVRFKEIINSDVFNESEHNLPIGLGKDIYGNIIVIDLFKMPHILIAGATGAGKSVCVNSIISSILFSKTPEDVRLILIDPKIVELKPYNSIPHLLVPVITDPKEAILVLKFLMFEMERRYSVLDQMGARDIVEYKSIRTKKRKAAAENFPFIVAIVDEFADLMSTSGKEAEILFARIAAKARAVGIHLVLATQRPSIDVITGLIKANIPARIAFQVISIQDSRIILDQKGADKLLGQGDMLYISPTQPFPTRLQGAFLSKNEVDQIADHWKNISPPNYINVRQILEDLKELNEEDDDGYYSDNNIDPLFQEAINIVFETLKASASYLQRRLSIGYNRAARMIEEMERMGIVGPQNGAKPREIIGSKPEL